MTKRTTWIWGACVLALLGCRQPNPAWQGAEEGGEETAAEGSSSTTDPMATVDGTTTGGATTENTTTDAGSSSTTSDATTGLQPCNSDGQCPDGLVCGPLGCQAGVEGDPCEDGDDCQPPAEKCGPNNTCQTGAAGDPCVNPGDCQAELDCLDDVCG